MSIFWPEWFPCSGKGSSNANSVHVVVLLVPGGNAGIQVHMGGSLMLGYIHRALIYHCDMTKCKMNTSIRKVMIVWVP